MHPARLLAALALVLALALAPGSCATARNYADPRGPWYATRAQHESGIIHLRRAVTVATVLIGSRNGGTSDHRPVWALLRLD